MLGCLQACHTSAKDGDGLDVAEVIRAFGQDASVEGSKHLTWPSSLSIVVEKAMFTALRASPKMVITSIKIFFYIRKLIPILGVHVRWSCNTLICDSRVPFEMRSESVTASGVEGCSNLSRHPVRHNALNPTIR